MSTKAVKESRPSYLAKAANELIATATQSSFDAATFFEKFELVAGMPKAIETLRFTIIELATLGRITQQIASEGCGRRLRELINEKHTQLRSQKVIKSKPIKHLHSDNLPPLPENWDWTSLGEICDYAYSNKVESSDIPGDAWLLELEDVEKETSRILRRKSFHESPSLSTKSEFSQGDVLYCKLRPYLNKVVVANESGYCTTEIIPIRTFGLVASEYLALAMRRPTFVAYANSKSFGMNLPRLSTNDARLAPIPLPPLAEQKRIVAKVDELMGLCDRLEALEAERKERHASLSRAALARFADSPTPTNLQFLFHNSFDVEPGELRKIILSLAVNGLLVPHETLTPEQAERDFASLTSQRESSTSRKTKIDESANFEDLVVPPNWLSVRLGEAVSIRTGFAFKSGDYSESGTFILRVTNINSDGSFDTNNAVYLPECKIDNKTKSYLLEAGELLVVMVGGSLGKIGLVTDQILPALLNQNMWRLKPYAGELEVGFLRLVLTDLNENRLQITTSTHGHLAMGNYAASPIPFPPLAEQKRIVAKVDELMALVDQLEQQLAHSRTLGQQLLEAIVANLTANHG